MKLPTSRTLPLITALATAVLCFLAPGPTLSASDLSAGLVAHFPFDGDARDASGNGHHGVVEGAVLAVDRKGVPERAYAFGGGTERIVVPASPAFELATQLSISAWVKRGEIGHVDPILCKDDHQPNGSSHFHFKFEADNRLSFTYFNGGWGGGQVNAMVVDTQWHHVAVTVDGPIIKFFLDGQGVGEINDGRGMLPGNEPLQIGEAQAAGFARLKGTLDDVRLYNRPLPASEVAQLAFVTPTLPVWTAAGALAAGRVGHTTTLLDNGKLLIVGGTSTGASAEALASCELFDPSSLSATAAPPLLQARSHHQAVRLRDGKILVTGGVGPGGTGAGSYLNSAELYDPVANTWSVVAAMAASTADHRLVLLNDGKVLRVCGSNLQGFGTTHCEIYDPATNTWTDTGPTSVGGHSRACIKLRDGRVLAAGGYMFSSAIEVYDPATGAWTVVGQLRNSVGGASAVQLNDGRVLIMGGEYWSGHHTQFPTVDVFDPATGAVSAGPDMLTGRAFFDVVKLPGGDILAIGGAFSHPDYATIEACDRFVVASGRWEVGPALAESRMNFQAVVVNGKAFVVGGWLARPEGGRPLATLEQLDMSGAGGGADLTLGLVAYYPFDGSPADASGHGHDGVPNGAVGYQPGRVGSAAAFDGTGYLRVADAPDLQLTNFAISAWIQLSPGYTANDGYDAAHVLCKGAVYGTLGPDYEIRLGSKAENSDKQVLLEFNGSAGATVTGPVLEPSTWHHVAGMFQNGQSRLYLDGTLVASTTETFSQVRLSGHPLFLGARYDQPFVAGGFRGLIDDLRLYSRGLSVEEVRLLAIRPPEPPVLLSQPESSVVAPGQNATFAVRSSGFPAPSWQWRRNGAALSDGGRTSGSTTPTLTIIGAQPEDVADYSVMVSNAAGATNSVAARLILRHPAHDKAGPMVWIPAGTFTMGSPDTEQDRYVSEGPQTVVSLTRGFFLGEFEVTQGDYQALMADNPSQFKGDPMLPVERVSWLEAASYCARLTDAERAAGRLQAGWAYRLPTEAEWEYAARCGRTSRYSFGDDPGYTLVHDYVWNLANSVASTHPVGTRLPSPWGLHDMGGNVWEWCSDWQVFEYPGGSVSDPQGPPTGTYHVLRGGAWDYTPAFCRAATRVGDVPTGRSYVSGFRLVLAQLPAQEVSVSQSAGCYLSPGLLTINAQITTAPGRKIYSLLWRPTLPAGWTLQGVSGGGSPEIKSGEIVFTGVLPGSPVACALTVVVPAGQTGEKSVDGVVEYLLGGMVNPATVNVDPAPLRIQPCHPNTADYREPLWVLDGTEVNRVLAYWRAQGYHCEATGLDGFAADPGSIACGRHAADFLEPAGLIDGTEVNRALAYWRAGGYHPDPAGLDGYAPGPVGGHEGGAFGGSVKSVSQRGPAAYRPAQTLTVTNSLAYDGQMLALLWRPRLPAGWNLVSADGDGYPEVLRGELVWTGTMPPSPIIVRYEVQVPTDAAGRQELSAQVEFQLDGSANPSLIQAGASPLILEPEAPGAPPTFERIRILPGGVLVVELRVTPGTGYEVQATEDFVSWTAIASGRSVDGRVVVTEPGAGPGRTRFFRAKVLP